jgi:hypothetical protein
MQTSQPDLQSNKPSITPQLTGKDMTNQPSGLQYNNSDIKTQHFSQHHSFDVNLACKYGIQASLIIHHLIFWISFNKRLKKNFKDGRWWMYQTQEDMAAHFPYLSRKQVMRVLDGLVQRGLIIKGNFNQSNMNHTTWYAFKDDSFLNNVYDCPQMDNRLPESGQRLSESGQSIITESKETDTYKDNVLDNVKEPEKTLTQCKKRVKEIDPVIRWKLTPPQAEVFRWLQDQKINTDDPTLAYWSKTFSYQRLSDVLAVSKSKTRSNLAGYISTLLKKGAIVENEVTKINKQTAKNFKQENHWGALSILEKYAKIQMSNGSIEDLPYHLDPLAFLEKLINLYELA